MSYSKIINISFYLVTLVVLFTVLAPYNTITGGYLIGLHIDKLIHTIGFFIWSLLFGFFLYVRKFKGFSLLLFLLVIATIFNITTEFFQLLLPFNRIASIEDAFANQLGISISILVLYVLVHKEN